MDPTNIPWLNPWIGIWDASNQPIFPWFFVCCPSLGIPWFLRWIKNQSPWIGNDQVIGGSFPQPPVKQKQRRFHRPLFAAAVLTRAVLPRRIGGAEGGGFGGKSRQITGNSMFSIKVQTREMGVLLQIDLEDTPPNKDT